MMGVGVGVIQSQTHSLSVCCCNQYKYQQQQRSHVKVNVYLISKHSSMSTFGNIRRGPRRRRNAKVATRSSTSDSTSTSSTPESKENEDGNRKNPDLKTLLRRFWKVAAPYWYSEDDKVQARLQLAAVFALTLGTTGISVGFNFLGRDFYNALASNFTFTFHFFSTTSSPFTILTCFYFCFGEKKTRTKNNSRSNFCITWVPLLVEFR